LDLLRRPDVSYRDLMTLPGAGVGVGDSKVAEQVEIQAKYQGYIARQQEEVARHQYYEAMILPLGLDYRECMGYPSRCNRSLTCTSLKRWGRQGEFPG